MPHFTQDWFSDRSHVFDRYLVEDMDILEIGAFEGRSALWMLENKRPKSLTIVEPGLYTKDNNYLLRSNLKDYHYQLIEKTSSEAASDYIFREFDFVYVDGDHRARACLFDMTIGWSVLRAGGIIAVDDYGSSTLDSDGTKVCDAVNYFLEKYDNYTILENSYQIWLRKE